MCIVDRCIADWDWNLAGDGGKRGLNSGAGGSEPISESHGPMMGPAVSSAAQGSSSVSSISSVSSPYLPLLFPYVVA